MFHRRTPTLRTRPLRTRPLGTRSPVRALTAAATAAAVLALGGCQSGTPDAAAKADSGPSVVAPGKPGEAAETLSAEEAKKALGDDSPNSADFAYAQRMIEHHRQALEMTGLAKDRAGSGPVKRLAERIGAAQGPEIGAMEGWLKKNGGAGKHADHDHAAMPGMATKAQLAELRAARGDAFDALFLKLMITHHQGAVAMATEVLSEGNNVLVEEMANDVVAQQTSEINRMRGMS
ncbi:DUF305 domain-containing protein [Streptomyces pathocidini]|uniref:DUF305 domain-containing protein n=1 Tax=Streptomyces pathocidini TaxID=1650571 RepID=UPI003F4CDADF